MNSDNIISVATVVHDNEDLIEGFVEDVGRVLADNFKHFELIILDNGSLDNSVAVACKAAKEHKNVRILVLSKEYDDEISYTAALDNAIGDFVVLMDCTYDPPDLIPEMVKICSKGKDCVIAEYTGEHVEPVWYRSLMYIFYKILAIISTSDVKTSFTNYICFSRSMVEAIVKIKDRIRWIKLMNVEIGYRRDILQFNNIRRGDVKYRRKSIKRFLLRLEMLFSSSNYLLQAANLLSFSISLLSFTYIIYTFLVLLLKNNVAEGWASTSMVIATLFGFMFLILGVIGEYLSIVYQETKKGPLYHIAREISAGELYDLAQERNVK